MSSRRHNSEPYGRWHATIYMLLYLIEPLVINFFKRIPMESCFRRPKCHITSNKMMHDYWVFVSHMIPAYISDLGLMLVGKKPTMVRIYNKLHKAMTTLNFFTHNEWTWMHKNMDLLKHAMSPEDQKVKTCEKSRLSIEGLFLFFFS